MMKGGGFLSILSRYRFYFSLFSTKTLSVGIFFARTFFKHKFCLKFRKHTLPVNLTTLRNMQNNIPLVTVKEGKYRKSSVEQHAYDGHTSFFKYWTF